MIDFDVLAHQSAPDTHPEVLRAVVYVESGMNPWAIYDNTKKKGFSAKNKNHAVNIASGLIKQGHSLDLGLGQINSRNLKALKLSIRDVFDPCINIKAAETILGWGYNRALKKQHSTHLPLLRALSTYNTGTLDKGFRNGYVRKVVLAAAT